MHRTRIKMCGMTRAEDILHAGILGVDAIGLIFYPRSVRCIAVEQGKVLLKTLPLFVDVVAVFVDPEVELVRRVLSEMPIDYLQFHGDESPEFCQQFRQPYIKAVPALSAEHILQAAKHHQQAVAILLDTPSDSSRGGSGKTFDWKLIPQQCSKPLILAGGLNADNVKKAVSSGLIDAVDVCSGVEASSGIKDHNKMSQFVSACR
ncbi:phosphoribosylanthranilate isomerase [Legionella oakridgensis]|uniref:N-(5'-phosphoribosyl)anthranilate isomerase n=2 Tax=Legionella oakridgensis TaxID=29423 RepID=W0BAD4_9GAMM|nr:phosphoribosylanthranilate isomerase [Legionella oakridgensis]AHE67503.1 phosphoribosylanthranilate isomerase [Legionella oakridgensis ATCC 33761 = DSM 21215]ETO92920.1 phosphoribosylanthranilate isomerase [Legionella oakridgensis RV-2-2007]KTD37137.1 N-(5'-phosphoribosyl)anthranilate isomerase [Legionella oakridgensis]STY20550.1 N-(5'-phosphoribosyl)anthranilate isomerase [Legionella longbeachae]